MHFQNKTGVEVWILIGKAIIVFLAGGFAFHMIVMFTDYFLMIKPFYFNN